MTMSGVSAVRHEETSLQSLNLRAALAVALIFFCSHLAAMPAADITVQLVQPDGETFNATPAGDEWNNRMETPQGFTVARDAKGIWRYVTGYGPGKSPQFNATPANRPAPPGLAKHISTGSARPQGAPGAGTEGSTSSAPNLGPAVSSTSPVLFILVEFDNQLHLTSEASWGSFVSNNVHNFFSETSHGNANLSPATESSASGTGTSNDGVVGWLNVGTSHPDTAGNTGTTNRNLAADAIIAANPFVDFSSYDTSGNGYVESDELSVVVIVAGYETAYGGTAPGGALSPSVWGHKWGWIPNSAPQVDGVKILEYAQFGELHAYGNGSNEHQATMGIMVHELGHLAYGLPDLYDTDGTSSGIGAFGLMSSGSWGKSSSDPWAGQTPVSASAWSKYVLNWVDDLEGSGLESIDSSGTGTAANTVFRASTPNSDQYFLVENRQPTGYDRGLERWLGSSFTGGLAIWHIDDTKTSNANDANRLVHLEEADGTPMEMETSSYDRQGSSDDLWRNGAAFNATSNPNSNLYNGSDSGVTISGFSTASNTMTVDFGTPVEPPVTPADPTIDNVIDNRDGTATFSWFFDGDVTNLTGFELQRQKAHKKRPNVWTETVTLPDADASERLRIDASGTGTFRYLVRAMNETESSSWIFSQNTQITGDGGNEPPQQCPADLAPAGSICTSNSECCSNSCKGKPGAKTCK